MLDLSFIHNLHEREKVELISEISHSMLNDASLFLLLMLAREISWLQAILPRKRTLGKGYVKLYLNLQLLDHHNMIQTVISIYTWSLYHMIFKLYIDQHILRFNNQLPSLGHIGHHHLIHISRTITWSTTCQTPSFNQSSSIVTWTLFKDHHFNQHIRWCHLSYQALNNNTNEDFS